MTRPMGSSVSTKAPAGTHEVQAADEDPTKVGQMAYEPWA
jgi:hypothetical protein